MFLVEEFLHPRQLADFLEYPDEIAAVGVVRRLAAEEQLVLVACPLQPRAGAGELGRLDEFVVLQEAHKHTTQHPGHRDLGQLIIPPRLVGERGAALLLGLIVACLERRVDLRVGIAAPPQVVLQPLDHGGAGGLLAFEVGEKFFGVDHGAEVTGKGDRGI